MERVTLGQELRDDQAESENLARVALVKVGTAGGTARCYSALASASRVESKHVAELRAYLRNYLHRRPLYSPRSLCQGKTYLVSVELA